MSDDTSCTDNWMMFYYVRPDPDRFVAELRNWAAAGNFKTSMAQVVFLGRVMASNPHRVEGWLDELSNLQPEDRESLHMAAWLSETKQALAYLARVDPRPEFARRPSDILERPIDSGMALDALWAYYFATGEPHAARRIVSALDHLGDRGAAARFRETAQTEDDTRRAMNDALFQAASWSLGDLMRRHPPLQKLCEDILETKNLTPNETIALERIRQPRHS